MSAYLTSEEIAAELRCNVRKVREEAKRIRDAGKHCGINLQGPAGWRYTPAEVELIKQSMAPAPAPRRRRRAA